MDFSFSRKCDKWDFPGVSGLEADGGAGGDVEAETARGFTIEPEAVVDFHEVEMAADLHRTVAGVGNY
jgi:hypothetical protein